MKLRLSNKTFYNRHNLELERYLIESNVLHIINLNSKNKILEEFSEKYYVNSSEGKGYNLDNINKKFEAVILTDILEESDDIYRLLESLSNLLHPNGKLIISSVNSKWIGVMKIFEFFRLKDYQNKISVIQNKKLNTIANGLGFENINYSSRQYFPFRLFFIGDLINKLLESFFFFTNFGIKTYLVFRKTSNKNKSNKKSIIIPAKNEEGNINNLIDRIPKVERYEIIISCGLSKDNTTQISRERAQKEKFFDIKVIEQSGNGKANAVWEGVDVATGEVLAILDADISVEPETIPDFFSIIDQNNADFVNGTRLVYEMESGSMRWINKKGNRIFQLIIGFIIKKPLTDTLCGTKVFKRELIPKIKWWQDKFNLHDPFCDFDLIFSASYFNEKIIEYPVHYKSRTYGQTQISRFRDGYTLIKYLLRSYIIFNSSRQR